MGRFHQRTACRVLSAAALLGIICFVVAGCGGGARKDKITMVDGKVLYKGKPVTGGLIKLNYEDGKTFSTTLNPMDGGFRIAGIRVGKATVTVDTTGIKTAMIKMPPMPKMTNPELKAKMQEMQQGQPIYVEIPRIYQNKATSPLHWEIHEGENHENDVELKR